MFQLIFFFEIILLAEFGLNKELITTKSKKIENIPPSQE